MEKLTITTDNKWKHFHYRNEVPAKVLTSQFDYLDDDSGLDGFFHYRKRWYHISDFMRIDDNSPYPQRWHGYSADSFYSAVLVEFSKDGESYRVATAIC